MLKAFEEMGWELSFKWVSSSFYGRGKTGSKESVGKLRTRAKTWDTVSKHIFLLGKSEICIQVVGLRSSAVPVIALPLKLSWRMYSPLEGKKRQQIPHSLEKAP